LNLRFSVQAGTNIGIGDSDNYAGNLVPLSAGVAYEENPTISYVPLSGEEFMRRMLSPVSVNEWVLLAGMAKHPGHVFALAARRVNGLRNPLLGQEPPSPEFARFVELYDRLRRAAVLDIVKAPETKSEGNYFWDIHDYEDAHGDSVRELLDLLGIEVRFTCKHDRPLMSSKCSGPASRSPRPTSRPELSSRSRGRCRRKSDS